MEITIEILTAHYHGLVKLKTYCVSLGLHTYGKVKVLQLQLVIQRLSDQYIQNWYSYVNNSPKLITYKTVKIQFCHEKYLSCVLNYKHRVALSRLRCSAHKLMIEERRYRNTERNMRLCQFCNMNLTENEFHFLLVCPAFRTLRAACLPAY